MNLDVPNLALGLSLSLLTAIGCIPYERIVKQHGYGVVLFLQIMYLSLFFGGTMLFASPVSEIKGALSTPSSYKDIIVYVLTGSTSIIWFFLTKQMNVAGAAVFEIAYVPFLILIYWLYSAAHLSPAFWGGSMLVIAGVLLITWGQ